MSHDPVNHPEHYTSHPSGIECIEITRHMNFNTGNAMKYLWRAGLKPVDVNDGPGIEDAIQDLEKAVWYLRDEIERLFFMLGSDTPSLPEEPVGYEEVLKPLSQLFDEVEAEASTYKPMTAAEYKAMRERV